MRTALRRAMAASSMGALGSAPTAFALTAALLQIPDSNAVRRRFFDREDLDLGARSVTSGRREFHFTRAVYTGYWRRNWAIDYPKADRQFLIGVKRLLSHLDVSEDENPVRLDDPELNRFPFLYAVEVGRMALSEPEVLGLRRYLQAGGFLVVDDFWGSQEWANFESEIRRVLPGCTIVDLPPDHPLFSAFYDIKEFLQVPNIGNAMAGRTSERDGFTAYYRGIFDDKGRLVVAINANTDLGDAWEWAEVPEYPLKYSTFAYQMGVNLIVYAMSH
ncbi:MAG TPA: DUF4159 domain-containing protein [Vicinamibacteria bacterium]|nr:DUF4159 domain-containing protein [Vicinamibacteria bacterium]